MFLTAADVGALAAGDNVSELDNDAGYLDEAEVNNILNGLNPDGSPNPGSEGYLKPGDDVSELNNDAGYLTSADLPDDTLWLQGSGAIYPKELTDNVQVGGTAADPNISLDSDGSAEFAGDVSIGDNVFVNSSVGYVNALGFNAGSGNAVIATDGSAEFAGDVSIGDSTTFRDNAAIIAALPLAIRETFKSALSKWEKATPYVPEDPSTLPADETLREAIIRATTAGKINLNSDGSATFAANVGIGTDSPESLFHLKSDDAEVLQIMENSVGTVKLYSNNKNFIVDADQHRFRSESGDEYARILANGNVGIGTEAPAQQLHVQPAADNGGILVSNTQSNKFISCTASDEDTGYRFGYSKTAGGLIQRCDGNGNYISNTMVFTDSNDVGIGTTTPAEKLHVNGAGQFGGATPNGQNSGVNLYPQGCVQAAREADQVVWRSYTQGSSVATSSITGAGKLFATDYDLEALPSLSTAP